MSIARIDWDLTLFSRSWQHVLGHGIRWKCFVLFNSICLIQSSPAPDLGNGRGWGEDDRNPKTFHFCVFFSSFSPPSHHRKCVVSRALETKANRRRTVGRDAPFLSRWPPAPRSAGDTGRAPRPWKAKKKLNKTTKNKWNTKPNQHVAASRSFPFFRRYGFMDSRDWFSGIVVLFYFIF